jgi:phosphatidylserine decarboxylase
LVGALFVGSMSTVWHGDITPWRAAAAPADGIHHLAPSSAADLWQPRGAELGRFNMGSTVLLLLPPGLARWDPSLQPGAAVAVGQALGSVLLGASA